MSELWSTFMNNFKAWRGSPIAFNAILILEHLQRYGSWQTLTMPLSDCVVPLVLETVTKKWYETSIKIEEISRDGSTKSRWTRIVGMIVCNLHPFTVFHVTYFFNFIYTCITFWHYDSHAANVPEVNTFLCNFISTRRKLTMLCVDSWFLYHFFVYHLFHYKSININKPLK